MRSIFLLDTVTPIGTVCQSLQICSDSIYKSDYIDFYANAQHPLIMKQQSINDSVIKDLFGVFRKDFHEIKEAITGLHIGELIIKNTKAIALGMDEKYKKIKLNHLI